MTQTEADQSGVTWIPEAADPGAPAPRRRRRSRLMPALPLAVLGGALITAGVIGGPRLIGTSTGPSTAPPPPVTGKPILENIPVSLSPITGATVTPSASALVTVDRTVTDKRAPAVAAMFHTYFTGINNKDYVAVGRVLDPDGAVDPRDTDQMAAFAEGTGSARDSRVVLHALSTAGDGTTTADVRFRSEQEPGDGPDGRLDETCTVWQITYVVSGTDGAYRIVRGKGTSQPC
ncbi:hypothetical protein [Actinoplanes sp. NBRC 101535]|uniref:hypothetical protein n=1 Tax=Actinoplanes sp. NBRC 101535 TaxID=3032196 RepID=UPI002554C6C8|nr:hypothetical protein [Actinoplanes sp. NBRC 101535]